MLTLRRATHNARRSLRKLLFAIKRLMTIIGAIPSASTATTRFGTNWLGFHPFPNTWERLFLRCWWVLNLGALALVHLWTDHLGELPRQLIAGVSTLPGTTYYISQVAFLLACVSIAHWRTCIPSTFDFLFKSLSGSTADPTREGEYGTVLAEYRRWLDSRYRLILVGVYLALAVAWAASTRWMLKPEPLPTLQLSRSEVMSVWAYYLTWFWMFLLPSTYFTAASAWAMGVTAVALNRATDRFGIRIRPHHPDGCGGLEPLSRLCFANAWPLVVSGMFLAAFGSNLFPLGLEMAAEERVRTFARILFVWNSVLILVVFFLPLWKVHTKMVEQRRLEADKLAARIEAVIAKTHLLMDQGKVEEAKTESENLAILKSLHADEYWPTWPVNRAIKLRLVGSQVLSSLPMVLGVIPGLKEAIQHQAKQLLHL